MGERERRRTRHLAYPLADAPTQSYDADLTERILVEPLVTNSRVYSSVRSKRVGRMLRSVIDAKRSNRRTRCRMIERRIAATGARSLESRAKGQLSAGGSWRLYASQEAGL